MRPTRPTIRQPRDKALLAALTCLLLTLGALLAGTAAAKTSSHAPRSACSRHARHGSTPGCDKAKTRTSTVAKGKTKNKTNAKARTGKGHKHGTRTRRSAGKHAAKPGATVVLLAPATCEDETTPTRAADGSYLCEDGSEPACEDGASPIRPSGSGQPMCRLSPGQSAEGQEAQCEGESGECTTVEWTCEDEQEASSSEASSAGSQSCEASSDEGEPES